MRITCPSCQTSYRLPEGSVGAAGRDVRCARCGESWHAAPEPAETPEPAPLAMVADAPQAWGGGSEEDLADAWGDGAKDETDVSGDDTETAERAAPMGTPRRDIESAAQARRVVKGKRRLARRVIAGSIKTRIRVLRKYAGKVVFAAAVAALVMLVVKRDDIVRAVPDLGGLYRLAGLEVNLRGLEFRELRTVRDIDDGKPVLVVEGQVANISRTDKDVPSIRVALRTAQGEEIYAFAIEPEKLTLRAGETLAFRGRLTAPPMRAQRLQVRFTDSTMGKTARR